MLSREFAPERPKLAEPVEATVDGDQAYVRIGTPPSYIRLGAPAWSITRLLDGSRSVREVAHEAGCTEEQVRRLADQLGGGGLLEGSEAQQERHDSDVHRQSVFFLKFTWHDPRALGTVYDVVRRWIPPRWFAALAATLCVAGAAACLLSWTSMISQAQEAVSWSQVWQVWPAILLRAVVHELGHAFFCLSFGRSVAALGFGLYYFQPVAFTDVSDIWLLRRRWQRVLVHLGGPIVDVALLVASGVTVLAASDGLVETFAAYLLLSTLVGAAAGFNPLLRSDGYFVLTELLREDDLRDRALVLMATTAPWRLSVRDRTSAVLVTYGAVSFVYTLVIVGIGANVASRFVLHTVLGFDALPQAVMWSLGAGIALVLWTVMLRRARNATLA
ncbi:hypothetical protein DVA86_33170 [Streptomyces armeniacus]|uniref:PqqD family peptide modification chaperone n=1 Tax=Streptomyces armeniacus TaxID=83291 RepID=A0A345XYH7_9ACTN|nr:hypothetical protein [Streptomyces armeniacus]AXK36693.1 hypothetical protein DVA86_33170 [Streptomyces armeniacus]